MDKNCGLQTTAQESGDATQRKEGADTERRQGYSFSKELQGPDGGPGRSRPRSRGAATIINGGGTRTPGSGLFQIPVETLNKQSGSQLKGTRLEWERMTQWTADPLQRNQERAQGAGDTDAGVGPTAQVRPSGRVC